MPKLDRLGDVKKCPACGSATDPDAYHCPKCRNDFCFHCRARVSKDEEKSQCLNQACDYYGKLVCDRCDRTVTVDVPPGEYIELQDGWWPLLVPLIFIVAIVAWFYTTFWRAMGVGLAAFFLVGLGLHFTKINIFGRKYKVLQPRNETHHVCISCNEPVKPWR